MKLLHAADLHLDSPFCSLPPEEARARRQDQQKTLLALRDLALYHHAELVLLPGDLFDGEQTHPETVTFLARVLGEMNCPVCIAPGNHDCLSARSPYKTITWPENVHIFTSETIECFHIPEKNVKVYGYAFVSPQRVGDPLAGFSVEEDGSLHLGCFHTQVGSEGSDYAPIAPESLRQSGLHYAALGHVHRYNGVEISGRTYWAYSGCPQGRGFDETGDKGCLLVELSEGSTTVDFLPLPGPRYELLTVNVTGRDPGQALRQSLESHREDYCRVTLTGEAEPLELSGLRRECQGLCRTLQLKDDTTVARDLWARAGEETLTGLFLQTMKQKLAQATDEDKATVNMAVRFALAALENREFPDWEVEEC